MIKKVNVILNKKLNIKTIFLDRDGVINEKIENGYVRSLKEFKLKHKLIDAMKNISNFFDYVIIVTNQRGIGRNLMTELELNNIHDFLVDTFKVNNINLNLILHCPDINDSSMYRKPNTGLGLIAKEIFPNINFSNSVMVGDSHSDILFGEKLGMKTFYINNKSSKEINTVSYKSLYELSINLTKIYE